MSKPEELVIAEEAQYAAADAYHACLEAQTKRIDAGEWLKVQDATEMLELHQRMVDTSARVTQLHIKHYCRG